MDVRGRMRCGRAAAAVVAGLMLAACAARAPGPQDARATGPQDEGSLVRAAGVQRAVVRDAPVTAVTDGMTAFGHDLYRVAADPGHNTIMSPLSIAVAFAMARAGARGDTAAQIDRVLRFPPRDLHEAMNAITRQIVTTEDAPSPRQTTRNAAHPEPPVVALANGIFAQQGFVFRQEFLRVLAAQYGTGVHTVDFSAGDTAKRAIDAWVRRHTADLIKQLFDHLDPDTRLVLANALYLRASWQRLFGEEPTTDAPFTRADGRVVRTPTMHQTGQLRYAEGNGWQAVELPYADSELAMRIVVPTAKTAPADLLTPSTLAAVAAGLRARNVDLFLPRWKATTVIDLIGHLKYLGMTAPFDAADFSGISAEPLFIYQAIHRATITVDESGTEAAAVTGLAFLGSAPAGAETTIRADHPFAYEIVHRPTGAPLFIGHVADPTADN
jgi:serine protease inhibitor